MRRTLYLSWLRWRRHLRSVRPNTGLPAHRKAARLPAAMAATPLPGGDCLCRRSTLTA